MNTNESTKENINKLIEFRQAVYEHGMLARRDAMFNVLDALLAEGPVSSFAMLSQSSQFERKWPSLYAALEDGAIDSAWLRTFLARQVPRNGVCVFPLDGSPWPRPRSKVLDDRQVEAGIHFRKETLGWTLPRFQSKEAGDRWTELTSLACWMIFLARSIVEDTPLPWQKPQPRLTPQRVQQSLRPIFARIGSPARSPKVRGNAPGWPKGRLRTPKSRYRVVKKSPEAAKTA